MVAGRRPTGSGPVSPGAPQVFRVRERICAAAPPSFLCPDTGTHASCGRTAHHGEPLGAATAPPSGLLPQGDLCIARRGRPRSRPTGVQRAKPLCRGRGGAPHTNVGAGGWEEQRSSRRVTQRPRLRGSVERGPRPTRRDIRPFPSRPLASYTVPMAQLRAVRLPPVVRPVPTGEMRPNETVWKTPPTPAPGPGPRGEWLSMAQNGSLSEKSLRPRS